MSLYQEPGDYERYSFPDATWVEDPVIFEKAIPATALEICANSYFHLAREELFMQQLRGQSETAEMIYNLFVTGRHPYAVARDYICKWKAPKDRINPATGAPYLTPNDVRVTHMRAAEAAYELICGVLREQGIACRIDPAVVPHRPYSGSMDEELPWPILVTDTREYRERLKARLSE